MNSFKQFEQNTKGLSTPLSFIGYDSKGEIKTPSKVAIQGLIWWCEKHNIEYSIDEITMDFHVSAQSIYKIIGSKTLYRLAHIPENGPSTRHHPQKFQKRNAHTIITALDTSSFNFRTNTWTDIAIKSGAISTEGFVTDQTIVAA
jgi:hypothetical protein